MLCFAPVVTRPPKSAKPSEKYLAKLRRERGIQVGTRNFATRAAPGAQLSHARAPCAGTPPQRRQHGMRVLEGVRAGGRRRDRSLAEAGGLAEAGDGRRRAARRAGGAVGRRLAAAGGLGPEGRPGRVAAPRVGRLHHRGAARHAARVLLLFRVAEGGAGAGAGGGKSAIGRRCAGARDGEREHARAGAADAVRPLARARAGGGVGGGAEVHRGAERGDERAAEPNAPKVQRRACPPLRQQAEPLPLLPGAAV